MLIERDGHLFVQGAMTMAGAAALLSEGEARCTVADQVIDLAEVSVADSSALAVVLCWLRCARAQGRQLKVINPPQSVISLASLYGVDELLSSVVAGIAGKVTDTRA